MDLDPIHGYAPAPTQFELEAGGELSRAAHEFERSKRRLKEARNKAFQALMHHRDCAKYLNVMRGAKKGHAEPLKPAPKSGAAMWDDE